MADEKDDILAKTRPGPTFPNLGVSDDRRETPMVNTPLELENKSKLLVHSFAQHYGKKPSDPLQDKWLGAASRTPGVNTSFARGSALRAQTEKGQHPNAPVATQLHENFHLLFNRVAEKHGNKGRRLLAMNIFNSIPEKARHVLSGFVFYKYNGKPAPASSFHEEHLAHLLNYLNSPVERDAWLKAGAPHDRVYNDWHMKKAYKAVQRAAALADKNWVTRLLTPKELSKLHKSSDWNPSNEDLRHAMHMLSLEDESCAEFKAASFLANHYKPTDREIQEALSNNEGDLEAAALDAHRIPVNEENLKLLRKIIESSQELSKADMDLTALPRVVKPFSSDDIQMAQLVQSAFLANDIHEVKLNGKHSKGASLFKNPEDGTVWLLKPGSGSLSRAMGVAEESANQSRREVAFNLIGELLGLKAYLPKSHLLVIDGEDVAVLEFFSNNFKTLNQIKNEKKINVQLVFEQFNINGLLYKWAVMDYLLGQTDRHAGNLMMDDGFNIKFIDEGSAFAGSSYNPAKDPKSFVPFYLRVFSPKNFKVLSPQERYKVMPHLNANADASLKYWIDHISEGQIVYLMNKYGLNPQPFIERLNKIRDYRGSKSEFIKKFYTGLLEVEEHLHVKNN